jgi:glycosyltransferase involved in cell wall biosynthesis
MFNQFNYNIINLIYLSNTTLEKTIPNEYYEKPNTYEEVSNLMIQSIGPTDFIKNDVLSEITYLFMKLKETRIIVEDINKIVEQYSIDMIFFIGDIYVFYTNDDKKFNVPSYYWYPCHYFPLSRYDYTGLTCFSNLICLSPSIKIILEKEFPTKNVYYLPHVTENFGLLLNKLQIRNKMNIGQNKFVVLIVASFYESSNRKAIDVQLIAFKQFNKKYPNSLLYLKGSIPILVEVYPITKIIESLQFTDENFHWNKYNITEEALAELYTMSDVLLSCSKTEGFGVPIVEAQHYNTNVITSNFLSMAEHNFQKSSTSSRPPSTPFGVYSGLQNNVTEISTKTIHYGTEGQWSYPSSENICNKLEEIYLAEDKSNIFKKSEWITKELTSYNNVKQNLYKILK